MLGTLMFTSKLIIDAAPNIHLIGMFTVTFTAVYRTKALIPIYIFVFLTGLYGGFGLWWVPYIYIWTVLWAATMLVPKNLSPKIKYPVLTVICALHGLLYGVLYAPFQALAFGFNFKTTIAWISAGFWFDILHCTGNLFASILILPLSKLLIRLNFKRTF